MYERAGMPNGSGRHSYQFLLMGVLVDVGHPLAEFFFSQLLLQSLGVVLLGRDHEGVPAGDSDAAVEDPAFVVDELVSKVLGGAFDQRIATETDANASDALEQGVGRGRRERSFEVAPVLIVSDKAAA